MFATDEQTGRDVIRTKARNVTVRMSKQDHPGRQQLLMDMYQTPELVEQVYLHNDDVRIVFNGHPPMTVGNLLPEYLGRIQDRKTFVRNWKVTGGFPLETMQSNPEVIRNAPFGLNLEIEII